MNPISIEHGSAKRREILYVDWLLGNSCNYACTYCPKGLHDGSQPWQELQVVQSFARRLSTAALARGKRLHIQFTGGEVTVSPRFLDLLRDLRTVGISLGIISNGSRTLRWWQEAVAIINAVTLTFHPEFANITQFVEIVSLAAPKIETHVNITAHPDHFDDAVRAAEAVALRCERVSILLKPLFINFGSNLYPYTDAQLAILRTSRFTTRLPKPASSIRGEMRVIYEDGSERIVPPQRFIADATNRWRGWDCDAGLELISIDLLGNVYRGVCREGGVIGNIAHPESLSMPTSPIRCGREACTCLLDIMTSRRRR